MRDINIAERDVNTVNYERSRRNASWINIVVKITIPVVIAIIVYSIYKLTGVKLNDFGLK